MTTRSATRLAAALETTTPAAMAEISKGAGVPPRLGMRARSAKTVNATAYLLLCSAIGVDAVTGTRTVARERRGFAIGWQFFGAALFFARFNRRLNLRSAADIIGISAATLSRAECGQPIAIESYLKVSAFMSLPPESFLGFTGNSYCNIMKNNDFAAVAFHHSPPVERADRRYGARAVGTPPAWNSGPDNSAGAS